MKYRKLTTEELHGLEKEFINFLIINTITATDWEKIKATDQVKTNELIEQFSDLVFEKALQNIHFIERRTPQVLQIFHFKAGTIAMVGMMADANTGLDFTNPIDSYNLQKNIGDTSVKCFSLERPYASQREVELFQMLESGCLITDHSLFETLMQVAQ